MFYLSKAQTSVRMGDERSAELQGSLSRPNPRIQQDASLLFHLLFSILLMKQATFYCGISKSLILHLIIMNLHLAAAFARTISLSIREPSCASISRGFYSTCAKCKVKSRWPSRRSYSWTGWNSAESWSSRRRRRPISSAPSSNPSRSPKLIRTERG